MGRQSGEPQVFAVGEVGRQKPEVRREASEPASREQSGFDVGIGAFQSSDFRVLMSAPLRGAHPDGESDQALLND